MPRVISKRKKENKERKKVEGGTAQKNKTSSLPLEFAYQCISTLFSVQRLLSVVNLESSWTSLGSQHKQGSKKKTSAHDENVGTNLEDLFFIGIFHRKVKPSQRNDKRAWN